MTGQPRPGSRYRASCRCPPRPAARPRRRGDGCSAPACVAARAAEILLGPGLAGRVAGLPAEVRAGGARAAAPADQRPRRSVQNSGFGGNGGDLPESGRAALAAGPPGVADSSPTMAMAPAAGDGGAEVPYLRLTRADADQPVRGLGDEPRTPQWQRLPPLDRQLRKESFKRGGECRSMPWLC